MPWFAKPSDGVYWSDFSAIGLNLRVPIFTGFGTRAKVRQADVATPLTRHMLFTLKYRLRLKIA
jgi:hypothetical protein